MPKVSKALQQAIDALELTDIYLQRSNSECDEDFDPRFSEDLDELKIQHMHVVLESVLLHTQEEALFLRIIIRLGTRWISLDDEDEPHAQASIEADYVAEYKLREELSQKSIDQFAAKNASYHIWPYWREYLSSQTERMRLPKVILPMVQFVNK